MGTRDRARDEHCEFSLATNRRPTKAELQAAVHRRLPDLIAPDLKVLFCGTNPGLYSAALGQHFARPGNRFWKAMHASGFTRRLLARKVSKYKPGWVAFLGISAYRIAFLRPAAKLEPQPEYISGAGIWVLPNPSGLNAAYQSDKLAEEFRSLRRSVAPGV